MGKWSKRMDAGLFVSAGVLIADAAQGQADAVALPLVLLRLAATF